MNRKQINRLIAGGVLLCGFAFLSHLFNCDRRVTIAQLSLSHQRKLRITGDYCWEISQPLYYEISSQRQAITPPTSLTMSTGSGQGYRFNVFEAEGGNLIGILKTEVASPRFALPPASELILIQDLQSGETWTPEQQDFESFDSAKAMPKSAAEQKAIAQHYRRLFDRLRRENPQIPLPDSLAPTAPTIR